MQPVGCIPVQHLHTRLFPVQLVLLTVGNGGVVFFHPFVFVLLMVMEEAPQISAGRERKSIYFHRHCKVKSEEFGELDMLILLSS